MLNPDVVAWLAHVNVRDFNKDQTFFWIFVFFPPAFLDPNRHDLYFIGQTEQTNIKAA